MKGDAVHYGTTLHMHKKVKGPESWVPSPEFCKELEGEELALPEGTGKYYGGGNWKQGS
jgi:hypothetical protein